MATLDLSVVNIALPTLARTFGVPLTTVEWVVLAYVVTITGLLLSLGRLADRVGRRRVYGTGLALFLVASALCAAANSAGALIAARAFQGLGAAMMTANSAALLIANFPEEERGRALGAFGAMVGVGLALGPPLGGLLVAWSWRLIFLVNLPLGLVALELLRRSVPPDRPGSGPLALRIPSAVLWSGTLVLAMIGLSRGPADGWSARGVWVCFALAGAFAAALAIVERRSRDPLLPVALMRGPLGSATVLTLLGQALSIAVGFHLPHYLENVLRYDAATSGRTLALLPIVALVVAPLAGRWADRWGARPVATAGLAITAAGLFLLARLGVGFAPVPILGGTVLIGAGLGLFSVPNASAAMSSVPRAELGLASGLQATMRNLGIAGGAAGMAAIVGSRLAVHGGGSIATTGAATDPLAFTRASQDAYVAMGGVAVVATVLSWLRPGSGPRSDLQRAS
jgi:EmrB/QacA subfamily drug resistance transporter